MTPKTTTYLPPELWIKVLKSFNEESDLQDVWMTYRHVCTTFRDAVESIFIEKHLRKTWIRWNLGMMCDEEIGKVCLDTEFKFHALAEDKITAIFEADETSDKFLPAVRGGLENHVEETAKSYAYAITAPFHVVQVHRQLNDTPLPGLTFDKENVRISVNWREMYTRYFGEEVMFYKGLKQWQDENGLLKDDLASRAQGGGEAMMKAMFEAIRVFADHSEVIRKNARRARIKRQFKESEDYDWSFEKLGDAEEEEKVLKNLKEARQVASFADDSDYDEYEDEDEDEEGSEEGEEEEDSWEDASDDDQKEDGLD